MLFHYASARPYTQWLRSLHYRTFRIDPICRGVAQLVERVVRDHEAAGSSPVAPTIHFGLYELVRDYAASPQATSPVDLHSQLLSDSTFNPCSPYAKEEYLGACVDFLHGLLGPPWRGHCYPGHCSRNTGK